MKAVQTFWANVPDILRLTGGWVDFRFHLMAWALSSSLLKKYFQSTALYTDFTGKKILVDLLDLPYDEVHISQEKSGEIYPKELWVMRKMHTFSLINEPFVHVDGDVFFFHPPPEDLIGSNVVVQNFQYGFQCYPKAIKQLKSLNLPLPDFINQQGSDSMDAVNMGIVGGKDNQFFKAFFEQMAKYIDSYGSHILQNISKLETGYLNTFLEECCFFNYAINNGKTITPLFNIRFDDTYSELGNLLNNRYGYFHLIGQHKRNLFYCKLVQHKLKLLFPDVYQRVVNVVKSFIDSSGKKFRFVLQDPFFFLNSRLKEKGYPDRISVRNYLSRYKKYKNVNESQVCETILFEKEKHNTTIGQIELKAEYRIQEKNRFEFYENYLSVLSIQSRFTDHIQYKEDSPVFNRKITEGPNAGSEVRLSLVFDFDFGFEHSKEKIWDDFSIFILCMASSEKISINQLITEVFKSARPVKSKQKRKLINRIDLRIKELFLLGLIDYAIAEEASDNHTNEIKAAPASIVPEA